MQDSLAIKKTYYLLCLGMIVCCLLFGYHLESRSQIYYLWTLTGLLFIGYFLILTKYNQSNYYTSGFQLAVLLRLTLLFSFPLLSDDYYRFIWDGTQLLEGINPFAYKPSEIMAMKLPFADEHLFKAMNSSDYYSVYPPINQFIFLLSAIPGKNNIIGSIIIIRIFLIIFDVGNIFLIKKLLQRHGLNKNYLFTYALNPLVIIEFTGNLHFEGVMIFFCLLTIWFLEKGKWAQAAVALACGICTKLLPLIFLPFFIKYVGWRKAIFSGILCGIIVFILFFPFINNWELLGNLMESIHLYYGKFEFNGSVYQLLKIAGWEVLGYNPIAYTSKILLAFSLISFIFIYWKCKNIYEGIFWLIFTYNLFGAIVHPWYILIMVAMTPFINWRFGVVWSALMVLSYFTYRSSPYQESGWLVFIAYALLFMFLVYEIYNAKYHKERSITVRLTA